MTKDTLSVLQKGDFGPLLQLQGDKEEYDSKSEEETGIIARTVIEKYYQRAQEKPLVFVFTGTLGAGKTVFVKSMATYLGVHDVVSPTFVIYYEYDVDKDPVSKLVHADFYRLKDDSEFDYLGLEEFLKPGNVMCIEWSEKSESFLNKFIDNTHCVYIDITYTGATSRNISIQKNFTQ
jgi:tRNA threonylcarbamoyl adenosine modification protein YjeE